MPAVNDSEVSAFSTPSPPPVMTVAETVPPVKSDARPSAAQLSASCCEISPLSSASSPSVMQGSTLR